MGLSRSCLGCLGPFLLCLIKIYRSLIKLYNDLCHYVCYCEWYIVGSSLLCWKCYLSCSVKFRYYRVFAALNFLLFLVRSDFSKEALPSLHSGKDATLVIVETFTLLNTDAKSYSFLPK